MTKLVVIYTVLGTNNILDNIHSKPNNKKINNPTKFGKGFEQALHYVKIINNELKSTTKYHPMLIRQTNAKFSVNTKCW